MNSFLQKLGRVAALLTVPAMVFAITSAVISCDSDDDSSSSRSMCEDGWTTLSDGDTIAGLQYKCVEVEEDATVTLSGTVLFPKYTTLKVNPGVTFEAASDRLSYLIIDRGAKIEAEGTAVKPITFTSDKAAGSRGREDWGGIVINGYAPVNKNNATGEGNSGAYGAASGVAGEGDVHDDSGILKYVRIQFAGRLFTDEDELNGIALQGVGDGTEVDYVHTHNCADDGIEFFGGTVDVKHIVSTANGDDQFDWTEGWQGKAQFIAMIVLNGISADPRGIEGDNLNGANDALPRTTVQMYNATVLVNDAAWAQQAMLIRRGTAASLYNIFMGAGATAGTAYGLRTTETSTTCLVDNVILNGFPSGRELVQSAGILTVTNDKSAANTNYIANYDAVDDLDDLASAGSTVFVPATPAVGATPPSDGFFDTTATFIGCVGTTNWMTGWTSFPAN